MFRNLTHWLFTLFFCFTSAAHAQTTGCTDPQANNFNPAAVINNGSCTYNATSLPLTTKTSLSAPLLNESSGLVFVNGKLWTFNDSGNANDIYRIDTASSAVHQTVDISNATNVDWEDMAASPNHLLIGDFGNNNGNRQNLRIYRVNISDLTSTATSVSASIINFSYPDQTSFQSMPTNHNFDCEAMIFWNDSIHLFSKNWVNFQTKHYVVPNVPGTHVAILREVYNTGYLVTGGSISSTGVIALVGYLKTGTYPIYLTMFSGYNQPLFFSGNKRRFDLATQLVNGQLEAVEFYNGNLAFVSNENYVNGSTTVTAKLKRIDLSPYLTVNNPTPVPVANFVANKTSICPAEIVTFTNLSTNSPTSYQWSFPGGTPSSSTLQNPQVQYNSPGTYSVTLTATNAAGSNSHTKTNYIVVSGLPTAPAIPAGNTNICRSTTNNVYSVPAVNGATSYTWSVPSGASIVSGQGSNTVSINFSGSAANGSICVLASGSCGSSPASCLPVTVVKNAPSRPSSISGGITHCPGSTAVFSCPAVSRANSYNWTVPANATIVSGQGTTSITVNFSSSFTSGSVRVAAVNCIGSSSNRSITVTGKPSTPSGITGPYSVCANQSGITYSISAVTGATSYTWTVPSGATIMSGQNTTSVIVNYGSSAGAVKVRANNSCGSSSDRTKNIT